MNVTLFRKIGHCRYNSVKDLKIRSFMFIHVRLKYNDSYPYKTEKEKTGVEVSDSEEKAM